MLGAGIIIGIGAGRLVARRLAFHGADGLLAADALHASARTRYAVAWHGIGLALLTAVTLIARPSLVFVGAAAYPVGLLMAQLMGHVRLRRTGDMRLGWKARAWVHQPGAGAAAAVILLLSLLLARNLGTGALMAIAGVETMLFATTLTIVDYRTVRFMSIAGHDLWRIVIRHAQAMVPFVGITVPACCLTIGSTAAGIVAAVSIAMLLLLTLRVLAYRLHGKRLADFLVSLLAGLIVLVGYAMPVALPLVLMAIFWRLQRRGAAATWLLA